MPTMKNVFPATVAFLALAALPANAQGGAGERKVEDKGVYFSLPNGWDWDGEGIAIRRSFKWKDSQYDATAALVYETKKFADDQIRDIEAKVEASRGSLKNLKIRKRYKIGSHKCAIATYDRTRGEGEDAEHFEERVLIFRRGDGCFTWTEAFNKKISSQASSALESTRKNFKFVDTPETTIPKLREFDSIKASYKIPEDFEWTDRADAKSGEEKDPNAPVARVYTDVDVKGASLRCMFDLYIVPPPEGKKWGDQNSIYKAYLDVKPDEIFKQVASYENVEVIKKGELAGEKTVQYTFTGSFERNGPKQDFGVHLFTKKGYLIRWVEIYPHTKKPDPEVLGAVKAARGGLDF